MILVLRVGDVSISPEEFLENFRYLSGIGWVEGYGMDRLALSENHVRVRRELIKQLESLGAEVRFDEAGNIIAIIGEGDEAIAVGSHLDSVPGGGRFDGAYGVIAGLEVLRAIRKSGLRMKHKLMLVDFNNEEGSRWFPPLLGSGLTTGVLDKSYVYSLRDKHGTTFEEALRNSGFMGSGANNLYLNPPRFYVELHVEQGPELYREGVDIGVPVGVVGIRVFEVRFKGVGGHAATPVAWRRDALVAFSKLALRLREFSLLKGDRIRITIGRALVKPGISNVVARDVVFTVDMRSYDEGLLDEAEKYMVNSCTLVAEEEGVEFSYGKLWSLGRTVFDRDVVNVVRESCLELGYSCREMWSWAGHDAVYMSRISKTGMIFVPSVNGISHTKEEYTGDEDLVKGLLVLLKTILKLDTL